MINKKNVDEIKTFLKAKPGYLKEGARRLQSILLNRGILVNEEECSSALRESYQESKSVELLENPKILFYDIETSYLITSSWRIGYNINLDHGDIIEPKKIICVSYKWLGEDQVYNLSWDSNRDDKFLLEQFIEVLNEADMIVAHNGDKYDIRFIRTRALFHGLDMLVTYPQFDTLKVAKKKFMFDSNKLDNIGKDLGVGQKIKTDKKLWDDVILRQDPKALDQMISYCDQDVILLERVYNKLAKHEYPRFHQGLSLGKDKLTSPVSGSKNIELVKTITTAKGGIKHIMKDLDTNRLFEMSDTYYKKFISES